MRTRTCMWLLAGAGLLQACGCSGSAPHDQPALLAGSKEAFSIEGVNPASLDQVDRKERFAVAVKGLTFDDGFMKVREEHAIKRDPATARTMIELGRVAYENNDRDLATLRFATAFRADDSDPKAAIWLVKAFTMKGKTSERIAAARTAALLAPRSAEAHYELGLAFWTRGDLAAGDLTAAKWAFMDALLDDAGHGPSLERLAVASYFEGDGAGARAYLARARAVGQPVPAQLDALLADVP